MARSLTTYQVNFTVRGKDIRRVTKWIFTLLHASLRQDAFEWFGVESFSGLRVEKQAGRGQQ
jgi:hypothetical protein